ncbi:hypothetical protein [Dapis sp. BLCC M229]|uniref:hypothetical protein n=1 Tax=Dapis sp. BLCC M229 TaxID=3400188 RepID=UPI003CF58B16
MHGSFLFFLCLEVAHIDRTLAQENLQKVVICSPKNPNNITYELFDECTSVVNGKLQVGNE